MTRTARRPVPSLALVAALAIPTGAAAGLWTPVGCPPADAARYAEARQRIVEAKPGDEEHVPYPYPQAARHAVADFLHTYRQMVTNDAGRMPADDRRFFERLEEGRLRAVVATVANWTPVRCARDRRIDFYFLVRFFDRRTGREVLRGAARDSGHVGVLVHLDDRPEEDAPILQVPVPVLSEARATARARLGRPVTGAQLVTAWGNVHCDELMPCVALRAGDSIYLLHRDELWRIADERPFESVREHYRSRAATEAFHRRLSKGQERLVSVGGDAIAKLVPVDR